MLIFRTAGPWGAGKGANLLPDEVDQNFWDLLQQVLALETNPPAPIDIADIIVQGRLFWIVLTDASQRGPFELPVAAFRWRQQWQPETVYQALDWFWVPDLGTFVALRDHVSAETFDPGAQAEESTDEPAGAIYHQLAGAVGGGGASRNVVTAIVENDPPAYEIPSLADDGPTPRGTYFRIGHEGTEIIDFVRVRFPANPTEADLGYECRFSQLSDDAPLQFFIAGAIGQIWFRAGALAGTLERGAVVNAKLVHVDEANQANTRWELWGDLGELGT